MYHNREVWSLAYNFSEIILKLAARVVESTGTWFGESESSLRKERDFQVEIMANNIEAYAQKISDDYVQDAKRFRYLMKHGRCESKRGFGLDIGEREKSFFQCRYWMDSSEVIKELDRLIKNDYS